MRQEEDCRSRVAGRADVNIDHLAELIDSPEHIGGDSGDRDVCLINTPLAAGPVSCWPRQLLIEGREALDPVENGRGVHMDPMLSQQLGHIHIGEPIGEIPPDSKGDNAVWEAVTAEGGGRSTGLTTPAP
jgi:hypothetical protein